MNHRSRAVALKLENIIKHKRKEDKQCMIINGKLYNTKQQLMLDDILMVYQLMILIIMMKNFIVSVQANIFKWKVPLLNMLNTLMMVVGHMAKIFFRFL